MTLGELTSNNFEKKILGLLRKRLLSVSQVAKELGIRRDVAFLLTKYKRLRMECKWLEYNRLSVTGLFCHPL